MDWQDFPLRDALTIGTLVVLLAMTACSREPATAAPPATTAMPAAAAPVMPTVTGAPTASAATQRNVVINGQPLGAAQLAELESHFQLRINDGRYWYDRISGAATGLEERITEMEGAQVRLGMLQSQLTSATGQLLLPQVS